MYTLIITAAFALILVAMAMFIVIKKKNQKEITKVLDKAESETAIEHTKKEFLCTRNEQKFLFALQKAISSHNHLIHCQTSLIELVEPVEFRHKSKAWTKRVDFVITDTSSKILAVIELDDYTHKQNKRIKRDKYVNQALSGNHPLVRFATTNFYKPENIAEALEVKAMILNQFKSLNDKPTEQKKIA